MKPLGYVVMRHSVMLNRPVKAFLKWIKKIPAEYRRAVLQENNPAAQEIDTDEHLLAHLVTTHPPLFVIPAPLPSFNA